MTFPSVGLPNENHSYEVIWGIAQLMALLSLPSLVSVAGGIRWIFCNLDTNFASVATWGAGILGIRTPNPSKKSTQ